MRWPADCEDSQPLASGNSPAASPPGFTVLTFLIGLVIRFLSLQRISRGRSWKQAQGPQGVTLKKQQASPRGREEGGAKLPASWGLQPSPLPWFSKAREVGFKKGLGRKNNSVTGTM